MPSSFQVLLAAAEPSRARLLERGLRAIGGATLRCLAAGDCLADAVAAADAVVVDLPRPAREILDELRRASVDNPRPIVMFVGCDDRAFMEEAIVAGVTSYHVAIAAFPEIEPIVMAAIALFRQYRRVADDLVRATATLLERDAINRAKTLLMRQRDIDEPRAYRWLRRRAMSESRRMADIAVELLTAESCRDAREEEPRGGPDATPRNAGRTSKGGV